jgi:hypothetical protein
MGAVSIIITSNINKDAYAVSWREKCHERETISLFDGWRGVVLVAVHVLADSGAGGQSVFFAIHWFISGRR